MSNAVLNSWERLNVHRAWKLCNAWLPRGGDLQALGMLMDTVIILKNRFTDDGRAREAFCSVDRPGYVLRKTAADLYVDVAHALSLLMENTTAPLSLEVLMIWVTVRGDKNSFFADSNYLHFLSRPSKLDCAGRRMGARASQGGLQWFPNPKEEEAIRQATTRTRRLLCYFNRRMRNFPAAWMYGRAVNPKYLLASNAVALYVPCFMLCMWLSPSFPACLLLLVCSLDAKQAGGLYS